MKAKLTTLLVASPMRSAWLILIVSMMVAACTNGGGGTSGY
jgi:hypothetical protein